MIWMIYIVPVRVGTGRFTKIHSLSDKKHIFRGAISVVWEDRGASNYYNLTYLTYTTYLPYLHNLTYLTYQTYLTYITNLKLLADFDSYYNLKTENNY